MVAGRYRKMTFENGIGIYKNRITIVVTDSFIAEIFDSFDAVLNTRNFYYNVWIKGGLDVARLLDENGGGGSLGDEGKGAVGVKLPAPESSLRAIMVEPS